jgi:Cft2 family RNA processing exonuclease
MVDNPQEPDQVDTELTSGSAKTDEPQGLLQLVVELRGLPQEISERTVPEALMHTPIVYAMGWLEQHRRECHRPNACPDTPGPLRMLLKVHSRDAILKSAPRIHTELWGRPDVTMIRQVRDRILGEHEDLANSVRAWEPSVIEQLRREICAGELGVQRVAAVLWAVGLENPEARELFRLLPVFDSDHHDEPSPAPQAKEPSEPSEKERHKRRRKEAEAKVAELEKEVGDLKADRRQKAEQLAAARRDLERTERERDAQDESRTQAEKDRDEGRDQLQELKGQVSDLGRDARRSQEANSSLRRELADFEHRLEELERERRRLTRDLAVARTQIESSEAALRAIPKGKDAIDAFLADEEQRIDEDLVILQGGDRQRAEEEHAKRQRLERAFRDAYPEYVPPRPTSIGATRTLQFTALGGGAEVGRSAYLIEIGSSRILVDCGIAVGRTDLAEMVPDLAALGRIDALVLTHAHTDHIGWVPALVSRQDPEMAIYCSEDTAAITPIMLDDARGHYERMLAREQRNAAHNPDAVPMTEEYTRDDLYEVETRLRALRFDDPQDIAGTALKLTLFPAGHILGAATVLLEGGGRKVILSGDISSQHQETVPPASPPLGVSDVDLLVLESTYGRGARDGGDARSELVDFVRQTCEQGTAILPCFALGRGQEVLQILLRAKQDGRLDPQVTIWVDGLIRQIIPMYTERERLDPVGFQTVEPGERSFAISMCQRPDARAVVVTTSGMLNGGPVVEWAQALLPEPRNHMALLGYQDEASAGGILGRKMRQRPRPPYELVMPQEEGGETRIRIASTIRELGLSAHADQDGLVSFARAISPRRIVLVHGDPEAQAALENRLIRELPDTVTSRPGAELLAVT